MDAAELPVVAAAATWLLVVSDVETVVVAE